MTMLNDRLPSAGRPRARAEGTQDRLAVKAAFSGISKTIESLQRESALLNAHARRSPTIGLGPRIITLRASVRDVCEAFADIVNSLPSRQRTDSQVSDVRRATEHLMASVPHSESVKQVFRR